VLDDVADQVKGGLGVVQPSVGGGDLFEVADGGFAEVPRTVASPRCRGRLDRSKPKGS
jgi:hypothetical protein